MVCVRKSESWDVYAQALDKEEMTQLPWEEMTKSISITQEDCGSLGIIISFSREYKKNHASKFFKKKENNKWKRTTEKAIDLVMKNKDDKEVSNYAENQRRVAEMSMLDDVATEAARLGEALIQRWGFDTEVDIMDVERSNGGSLRQETGSCSMWRQWTGRTSDQDRRLRKQRRQHSIPSGVLFAQIPLPPLLHFRFASNPAFLNVLPDCPLHCRLGSFRTLLHSPWCAPPLVKRFHSWFFFLHSPPFPPLLLYLPRECFFPATFLH